MNYVIDEYVPICGLVVACFGSFFNDSLNNEVKGREDLEDYFVQNPSPNKASFDLVLPKSKVGGPRGSYF